MQELRDALERLRYARAVATIWRDAYMAEHAKGTEGYWAIGTHPLALVLGALDGETDPVHLGVKPEELAAALEAAPVPEGTR